MSNRSTTCPDCWASVPDIDAPTHRYIGGAPGCWHLYTKLLAGIPPISQTARAGLIVDAYAAQHPGVDVPPARQSVAVHTVTLCGYFEHGRPPADLIGLRAAAAEWGHRNGFGWLDPAPAWAMTLIDVIDASHHDRGSVLDQYVEGAHRAWLGSHGATIEAWYQAITKSRHKRR